jgi:drug/metabolite transporter (DMT)-like permease
VLAVTAALQFGAVVVLSSSIFERGLPVWSVLAVRFGIAALLLGAVLAALRRPLVPAAGEHVPIVMLAVFGYAIEASFFLAALGHGTAAAVTLLFYTYPVFVSLGSWALLRRGAPPRRTVVALALAVAGAAIVVAVGGDLVIEPIGVVLALTSAVIITGYMLGADVVIRRTQPLTASLWVSGAVSISTFVAAIVTGRWQAPAGWAEWGTLAAMGVGTAGAFVTLLGGIRLIGAERSSIIGAMEPLAAALLAWAFLDEPVGVGVAVGGALILAAAILASVAQRSRAHEPAMP